MNLNAPPILSNDDDGFDERFDAIRDAQTERHLCGCDTYQNNLAPAPAMMTAALDLADRGFAIFPCTSVHAGRCSCRRPDCGSPGKHPLIAGGLKHATTDTEAVRAWWMTWPQANIGCAVGRSLGAFVIDIDGKHGGFDTLDRLEDEHGPLPPTVEARTGSGGRHLWFAMPDDKGLDIRNAAPIRLADGTKLAGIDVRGTGGYVMLPPSNHVAGAYRWLRHPDVVELADAPAWLLAVVAKPVRIEATT